MAPAFPPSLKLNLTASEHTEPCSTVLSLGDTSYYFQPGFLASPVGCIPALAYLTLSLPEPPPLSLFKRELFTSEQRYVWGKKSKYFQVLGCPPVSQTGREERGCQRLFPEGKPRLREGKGSAHSGLLSTRVACAPPSCLQHPAKIPVLRPGAQLGWESVRVIFATPGSKA